MRLWRSHAHTDHIHLFLLGIGKRLRVELIVSVAENHSPDTLCMDAFDTFQCLLLCIKPSDRVL